MAKLPNEFIQPRRRLTRQRSGYNVGGIKTGSECVIHKTSKLVISKNSFILNKHLQDLVFTKLFNDDIGIFGTGGYFKSSSKLSLNISVAITSNGAPIQKGEKSYHIEPNIWTRVACDLELNIPAEDHKYDANVVIELISESHPFEIEYFWLQAGVVKHYAEKANYKPFYYDNTDIYKPEIYYLDEESFDYDKVSTEHKDPGYIIGKSCNRCARFLPIDIENEKNSLGFSNHCKKRAPCQHNAFSRYKIENPENLNLIPDDIKSKSVIRLNGSDYVRTYMGFQLECRSCKKFEVNAPLNPLRNKSQHHEDGARRRAFERLIIDLMKVDIVKNFRFATGKEFQEYIWELFDRKCFGCDKALEKITDMDIDHTLPLSYLWPLDASATALCQTCNSLKHDLFPSEFKRYSKDKLKVLSLKTKIPLKVLESKEKLINKDVLNLLVKRVDWFFDDFLARKDYQKIKKGKKVADLIYKALNKVTSLENVDLIQEYFKLTKKFPSSISLTQD